MNLPIRPGSDPEVRDEAPTGRERRRNPRVSGPWPAIVEDSDGRLVTGEVIDVSLSGMKIRVNSNVAVGEAVKLRVTLPRDGGELEIAAEVVRRDPGGIGVDFGKLPVGAAERVKAFVPTWDLRRRASPSTTSHGCAPTSTRSSFPATDPRPPKTGRKLAQNQIDPPSART